ncbi:FadR/GntR family transcriptional regulator [Phytoactinopolyspora halotolerans]|uniref:FadR family transcriptional regulator n=1 Tax=Phytoactinopolyspora halotolerans TaxID=1981512 RepID=A0A6L9SCN1_9ACTN|nr:FCD domain-containing protein [Phytoactinopolyspora halotolerans]NEE03135.1 FadR family transcriptional regulator [Phytoactinopolyspora halotolerans]
MEESKFLAAQQRLREYIDQNGLRPGDGLPSEGALAAELGISRISLREATRSLQTLGVIEAKRGKGLYVSEFSFQPILDQLPYGMAVHGASLHEVLVVRETLEEGLIESVAKRMGADVVDDLDRLVDRMEEAEQTGGPLSDIDKEFHLRLFEPLGNQLVTHLIEIFWVLSDRLRGEELGVPLHVADVHRNIVRALRNGERLVPAMSAHFTDIRNRMEKHERSVRS